MGSPAEPMWKVRRLLAMSPAEVGLRIVRGITGRGAPARPSLRVRCSPRSRFWSVLSTRRTPARGSNVSWPTVAAVCSPAHVTSRRCRRRSVYWA